MSRTSIVLTTLWLLLLVLGVYVTSRFDYAPGVAAKAPEDWPSNATIERNRSGSTIVMVAHPKCTCTRASIAELALLMTRYQSQAKAVVLFIRPAGFAPDWEKTDTWRSASSIPGVKVVTDPEGKEATLFGAATSGQLYIYDRDGRLVFKGGITESRGHEGENANLDVALSAVQNPTRLLSTTAVYGCPLKSPERDTAGAPGRQPVSIAIPSK